MRYPWWVVLGAFFLLAVAMRWGSFFISVIDHDESTYIVIADELLRGEAYLRDVIDTKPIGIFWIYAALIKLTGGSIFLLRLAAAAFVALGAFLLSVTTFRATHRPLSGYVAGVVYILMCSVYKFYGVSPNTEIFFNVFTIAAVAAAVATSRKQWLVAGLLLGTGFVIKPFVAAEALAVGLYLVWYYRREPARIIGRGMVLVGGFLLPVAAVVAYFYHLDLLDALWFYSVKVNGAYPIELPWYLRLKFMGDYLLRYAPIVLLGVGAQVLGKADERHREWTAYLLLQFLLVSVVVMLTGKRFGHYQVQLHPIVALYVGAWVGYTWEHVLRRRWVPVVVAVVSLGLGVVHFFYYQKKADEPRVIAAYLAPRLAPGETFFTLNGFQITYHLLDRPVPTPYVHSSLLFFEHHARAFRIDEAAEAQRIIDDPSVRYLVGRINDPETNTSLTETLMPHFHPAGDITHDLRVWERNQ
ncbi:ArnT family glycosyltransferase [Neolewinella litorea]|uniref:Glycosyltransferase RgtA/B/C/D-like domain-containing protein n=1 Tax=Neolewinella litorea TaxID=2562452 RepID=A0A4S4NLF4_9BACT|nr:glycosyltransferase family 39 protein [Neolewinella litorea]THH40724.1 hypothetical protein E4021_08330 [Neolewinella litorea]